MLKLMRVLAMALVFVGAGQTQAGIPVIDSANLANSVKQVIAWGTQYTQMATQYQQLVQQYNQAVTTYNSMNGVRGMAGLVNNPASRRYMPNEWNQAMNLISSPGGYTSLQSSINGIKSASQIVGINSTGLSPTSAAGRAFQGAQNQAATNRALSEEGFKQASDRITSMQTLIDSVNGAPDAKDVADLSARIEAEQAMLQNESNKLQLLTQLQQAQRDIQSQQAREISMQSTKAAGGVARF
ncbi:MAG: P-type DNA transfer protein VirB5 [Cytophagaceae bacterium]|nr:MAG: P-type DNA transfer protein VirB5 [Cytophagaceae bacterium]